MNKTISTTDSLDRLHSYNDQPAYVVFDNKEKLRKEYWYKHGKIHRLRKPAIIEYNKDGIIIKEQYEVNGMENSYKDIPSFTEYYNNGIVCTQKWLKNSNYFRDNDKPSFISYDKKGKIKSKSWIREMSLHRLYGPAFIEGKQEDWWINDKWITDQVMKFIKENKLPHYSEWNKNHKMLFRLMFDK